MATDFRRRAYFNIYITQKTPITLTKKAMEDKDRNPRRGSVDTPRLPSKVTIFDLLQIILGIKEEKLDSLLRREISEKILSFLTGFGIHQSLLQCGTLIEIDDRGEPVLDDERNEIKKQ